MDGLIFLVYKRYLFARRTRLSGGNAVFVTVDAKNKDQALSALVRTWPQVPRSDWDLLEELDEEAEIGALGDHINADSLIQPVYLH